MFGWLTISTILLNVIRCRRGGGVEALISAGAETIFGDGTVEFLREAHRRQEYMRKEIVRRYGMEDVYIPF